METLIKVIGVMALFSIIVLVFTYPVMLLINYTFAPALLTVVFGTAKISFWKTLTLGLVSSFLFKSSK